MLFPFWVVCYDIYHLIRKQVITKKELHRSLLVVAEIQVPWVELSTLSGL